MPDTLRNEGKVSLRWQCRVWMEDVTGGQHLVVAHEFEVVRVTSIKQLELSRAIDRFVGGDVVKLNVGRVVIDEEGPNPIACIGRTGRDVGPRDGNVRMRCPGIICGTSCKERGLCGRVGQEESEETKMNPH